MSGVPIYFEAPSGEPIAIANTVHLFSDHIRAGSPAGLLCWARELGGSAMPAARKKLPT